MMILVLNFGSVRLFVYSQGNIKKIISFMLYTYSVISLTLWLGFVGGGEERSCYRHDEKENVYLYALPSAALDLAISKHDDGQTANSAITVFTTRFKNWRISK